MGLSSSPYSCRTASIQVTFCPFSWCFLGATSWLLCLCWPKGSVRTPLSSSPSDHPSFPQIARVRLFVGLAVSPASPTQQVGDVDGRSHIPPCGWEREEPKCRLIQITLVKQKLIIRVCYGVVTSNFQPYYGYTNAAHVSKIFSRFSPNNGKTRVSITLGL